MHINRLVERFLSENRLPPTKFGRLTVRDPRLVRDMRMGREIRSETEQILRNFMAQYQPVEREQKRKKV